MAVEKGVQVPLGEVDEVPPFPEEEIEIELEDDGSAVVDFMPETQTPETGFQDNLAEVLDDSSLGKLASELTITTKKIRNLEVNGIQLLRKV
jgi:hypothetical protein